MPEHDDRLVLPAPGGRLRNGDRRQRDRRAQGRAGTEDRRRRDRRRAAAGGLLLTGLSLAGALHGRGGSGQKPAPTVASEQARSTPPESVEASDEPESPPGPFDAIIAEAAETYGVDPDLVRAVIRTESNFNPRAKSRAGAKGLMQLMPILSKELGIKDPFDPRANVFGGTQYLSQLLERHDGNVTLALASFNAGPRNVARFRGIPPFKETRGYVRKITGLLADAATTSTDVDRGAAD